MNDERRPEVLIDPDTSVEYPRGSFGYERLAILRAARALVASLPGEALAVGQLWLAGIDEEVRKLREFAIRKQEEAITAYFEERLVPSGGQPRLCQDDRHTWERVSEHPVHGWRCRQCGCYSGVVAAEGEVIRP